MESDNDLEAGVIAGIVIGTWNPVFGVTSIGVLCFVMSGRGSSGAE